MTDTELIEGIIRRDRQAFGYLVSRYQEQVVKTAYYLTGNLEDAEDLSQDIFLEIMEAAKSFRHSASVSTWIYRITVNRSLNLIRRNKRREFIGRIGQMFKLDDPDGIIQGSGNQKGEIPGQAVKPAFPIEDAENRRLIRNAVDSLPENQRIAFVLNKFEELSYREISEVMNLSLASV